jgi:archaellum component FlaF (FlaF/FlaG flagellin family)
MLENIGTYSWATFAVVLLSALISFFTSRAKRKQNYFKKVDEARREYRKALESGTPEQIMLAKKKFERVKKALLVTLCCLLCSSCMTHERILPVGDYVKIPKPGDTVPDLPQGEKRWVLVSVPTGTDLILEQDR